MDPKEFENVKSGPLNDSTSDNKIPFKKDASYMSIEPIGEISPTMAIDRASSQLSSSLMNGLDSLDIISSQDSDALADFIDDEPITHNESTNDKLTSNKRKLDDIAKDDNSAIESHDHYQQPARKKVSTQLLPAKINPETQLSSFSFRSKQRENKPKTIYKIVFPNKKPTITSNITNQSKFKKGLNSHIPSQKTSVVSKEENSLPKRGRKKKHTGNILPSSSPSEPHGIFSDLRIFFIRNNIDTIRLDLMKEKVKAKGGNIVNVFDSSVTHVITALPGKSVHNALGLSDDKSLEGVLVLQPNWISMSITYNKLADVNFYTVSLSEEDNPQADKDLSNAPTTGAKRTNKNMISDDSENKSSRKIKKQTLSLTPERSFSLSPPSPKSNSDDPILPTLPPPSTGSANTVSNCNDPLLEMIEEARNLAKEGLYLDEEKDEEAGIFREKFSEDEVLESPTIQDEIDEDRDDNLDSNTLRDKTTSDEQLSGPSTFNPKKFRKESFVCLNKNTSEMKNSNPNKFIIDKLQILLDHYQMRKDEWRTLSYRKAISALKKCEKPVTSYEEANKIYGIGDSIASKISEIIETGNLRRIESTSKTDKIIGEFSAIHGVGPSLALKWYAKGYRSLGDVLQNVELTHAQRAAIECFEDLQQRIPRDEVSKISKVVESLAHKIDSRLELFTVGSYRRGNPTCGDVDILITRNDIDGKTHLGILPKLVDSLHDQGFLTHDLSQPSGDDLSSKYMGICRMPGGKHRRLDLFTILYNELGAALLSFTGNDIFNRSIRLLARKKKMKLSNHGLYNNVSRGPGGIGLTDGKLIAQQTEIEIFDALGVPWRPPSERNC